MASLLATAGTNVIGLPLSSCKLIINFRPFSQPNRNFGRQLLSSPSSPPWEGHVCVCVCVCLCLSSLTLQGVLRFVLKVVIHSFLGVCERTTTVSSKRKKVRLRMESYLCRIYRTSGHGEQASKVCARSSFFALFYASHM